MKNFKHIYCIALSFAFGISYAQTDKSLENTVAAVTVQPEKEIVVQDNTATSAETENNTTVGKPEFKIYPEPFLGIVSVNLNKCPGAKICVFDGKGKCIKMQDCKKEDCALFNLRDEPKGIYYLEIMVQGEKTVKAIYLNQNF